MMDIMEWKDRAKIAVILGSGLNDTIDEMMEIEETIPFHDIPDMPEATAPGHVGRFHYGTIAGVPAFALQGVCIFMKAAVWKMWCGRCTFFTRWAWRRSS